MPCVTALKSERRKYKYAITIPGAKGPYCGPEIDEALSTVWEQLHMLPGDVSEFVRLLSEPPLASEWSEFHDSFQALTRLLTALIAKGAIRGRLLRRTARYTISAYSRLQRHGHQRYVRKLTDAIRTHHPHLMMRCLYERLSLDRCFLAEIKEFVGTIRSDERKLLAGWLQSDEWGPNEAACFLLQAPAQDDVVIEEDEVQEEQDEDDDEFE
jgi:hypothetical protein